MNEQPSLFDDWNTVRQDSDVEYAATGSLLPQAHARTTDPVESHAAAASVDVRRNQANVLDVLQRHGPCTDAALVAFYEADQAVGVRVGPDLLSPQSPSGIRTRRKELIAAGKVRDSGARVRLESGRWAAVWEVVP